MIPKNFLTAQAIKKKNAFQAKDVLFYFSPKNCQELTKNSYEKALTMFKKYGLCLKRDETNIPAQQ